MVYAGEEVTLKKLSEDHPEPGQVDPLARHASSVPADFRKVAGTTPVLTDRVLRTLRKKPRSLTAHPEARFISQRTVWRMPAVKGSQRP